MLGEGVGWGHIQGKGEGGGVRVNRWRGWEGEGEREYML